MIFHPLSSTLILLEGWWTQLGLSSTENQYKRRGWFRRGGGGVDTYIWYMFRGINTPCYWLLLSLRPSSITLFLFWWSREGCMTWACPPSPVWLSICLSSFTKYITEQGSTAVLLHRVAAAGSKFHFYSQYSKLWSCLIAMNWYCTWAVCALGGQVVLER